MNKISTNTEIVPMTWLEKMILTQDDCESYEVKCQKPEVARKARKPAKHANVIYSKNCSES